MTAALRCDVAVIEIEITDHDAIGEDRKIMARLDAAAQDRRCRCRAHAARELDGDPTRFGVVSAERATDRVKNGALDRADEVARQVVVAERDGEIRERLCHRAAFRRWLISCRPELRFLLRARRQRCSRRHPGTVGDDVSQELPTRVPAPAGHTIPQPVVHLGVLLYPSSACQLRAQLLPSRQPPRGGPLHVAAALTSPRLPQGRSRTVFDGQRRGRNFARSFAQVPGEAPRPPPVQAGEGCRCIKMKLPCPRGGGAVNSTPSGPGTRYTGRRWRSRGLTWTPA